MSKMTVAEAAIHFNVSKEAIHNRIRRGSIDCVIENGVKYVVTGEEEPSKNRTDSRYYDYIEEENERLKSRIEKLEDETRHLRDQREQMLIEEREKIETIYKERDEQLKNVLQVVATKFLANMSVEHIIEDAVTAEVVDESEENLIVLKDFLKLKGYKEKKKEKIKKKFKSAAQNDSRLVIKKGKLYLDPQKYDYRDLLS